jgi:hypothetical protein
MGRAYGATELNNYKLSIQCIRMPVFGVSELYIRIRIRIRIRILQQSLTYTA